MVPRVATFYPVTEAMIDISADYDEYRAAKQVRSRRPPRTPSQILDRYWVEANARKNTVRFTPRSGKWLIFVPLNELDDAWERVKRATKAGLLGNHSKAATALPNPNA